MQIVLKTITGDDPAIKWRSFAPPVCKIGFNETSQRWKPNYIMLVTMEIAPSYSLANLTLSLQEKTSV
ncbi:hypothetical protein EFB08_10120 [Rufibacter latericius]|uniref:Uncharacterized protein n=1 Tax=Rufibacter latericius TaxID=2487040 RepID=A0A3M9MMU0_9BACT|nr:hypothetical protein EFB08_10120 [Rufibacter latericius]